MILVVTRRLHGGNNESFAKHIFITCTNLFMPFTCLHRTEIREKSSQRIEKNSLAGNDVPRANIKVTRAKNIFPGANKKIGRAENLFPCANKKVCRAKKVFPGADKKVARAENFFPRADKKVGRAKNLFPVANNKVARTEFDKYFAINITPHISGRKKTAFLKKNKFRRSIMSKNNSKISHLFVRAKEMLDVAETDDDIKLAISKYNMDSNALSEGKTILDEGDRLAKEFTRTAGEKKEQYLITCRVQKSARALFFEHFKLTQLALQDNPEKMSKLVGNSKIDRRTKEWLYQAEQFYAHAETDEELLQKLGKYGITVDKLKAGHESLHKLHSARESYNQLKGKFQDLVLRRNAAVKNVRKWLSGFILICRLALKENPQLLEKLGIQVLSPGYHRKKEEKKQGAESPGQPAPSA